MELTERTVEQRTVYRGRIVNVRDDIAALPDGKQVPREVVEFPGGVGVLPLDRDGTVTLVRQYRYPFGRETLEIPAGKLEPGEPPAEAGLRELREETGYRAGCYTYLGHILTCSGYSTEIVHMYLATELSAGEMSPDEDELIRLERMPLEALIERITRGEISDAKTVAAAFLAREWMKTGG